MKFLERFKKKSLPVSRVKHKWQLVSRSYASPVKSFVGIDIGKLPKGLAEKAMLGVTTYLWECLLTGDVRTEEIIGTDVQVLDELTNKVKQYGKQFFKDDDGQVFVLDAYQEPVDASTLPMRKA